LGVVNKIFLIPFYMGSRYYLLIGLGRKSRAQEYWEEYSEGDGEEGTWLVLYDFNRGKPNPRFWGNLKRLIGLAGGGGLVQYSVFRAESRRSAVTAARVAVHYGAEVALFKGEFVDFSV
jgi:hypothetical protein